jgi:hypothetical protein
MKKLLTLLFTAVIVFSLAMPVFAQDTSSQETSAKKTKKANASTKKAHANTKKAKAEPATKLKKT